MASQQVFDPWAYLAFQYGEVDAFHRHSFKRIHDFYKSCGSPSTGLKGLEFGAGPVIAYVISASLYASEIVLSEYRRQTQRCFRCGWIMIQMAQTGVPLSSMLFKSWRERAKKRLHREKRSCAKSSKRSPL